MIKNCTILLLTLLLAVPLFAQSQHSVARIEVRGNVPTDIVLSQSAVSEGKTYSVRDLDVAVARLRRLPFVYDARYSMEGNTLVFEVNAVSPFFGDLNASGNRFHGDDRGDTLLGAGGRKFLGSRGVAMGHIGGDFDGGEARTIVDAEYAHYGIAGTRLFATAGLGYAFRHEENVDSDPSLRLTVGYPLTIRQTLSASFVTSGFTSSRRIPILSQTLESKLDQRALSLRWAYDTTDDPFFARSGESISVTPSWIDDDSRFYSLAITAPDRAEVITTESDGIRTNLTVDARKLWSIGTRGAITAGIRASTEDREFLTRFPDATVIAGSVEERLATISAGYAHNLFDWNAPLSKGRHRLEFDLAAHRRQIDQGGNNLALDQASIGGAYVYRHRFANVRLGLSYTGNLD